MSRTLFTLWFPSRTLTINGIKQTHQDGVEVSLAGLVIGLSLALLFIMPIVAVFMTAK